MLRNLLGSRKWTIGTAYIAGVFACTLAGHPLSADALMWTGTVLGILIGGQHGQEMLALRRTGTPDPNNPQH